METLFVGQNAIFLPQVESTNSYAIELLKNVNPIEGTMIYTSDQTHGRGQRGNAWISQPGLNTAASFILKPTFLNLNKLFYLYIISALAVHDLMAEVLNNSQFDIKIKWPNDILVNSNKIAGILNENTINNGMISNSVIGIGINLNQTEFGDLKNVTSLKLLLNTEFDFKSILAKLSKYLEYYYLKLKSNKINSLLEEYYTHFYKLEKKQDFILNDKIVSLTVVGINKDGLFHLKDEKNEDHFFDIKEIKWA